MRPIDADALMEKFAVVVEPSNNSDFARVPTWNNAVSLVEETPTLDVVPVRHGKWVQRFIKIGGQVFKHGMQCSVCAEPALDDEGDDYLTNYCPNCGAKMDGERKEE